LLDVASLPVCRLIRILRSLVIRILRSLDIMAAIRITTGRPAPGAQLPWHQQVASLNEDGSS